MRVVVAGLGVQGHKRQAVAGAECVATVDPVNANAKYRRIEDVPARDYDAALVCTPDEAKVELLTYLLQNRKHVLVEKPLFGERRELESLKALAEKNGVACYTAYNHRFEPHFVNMKRLIDSGRLGRIYAIRMFYGNGTARLVRDSAWRDRGAGVLPDLGSHLLDTALFWLGRPTSGFRIHSASRFENHAFDHVAFGAGGEPLLQFEVTLLSWRNHHTTDVFAEKGSAHITSLCKWGPSTFIVRDRKLPSGRPDEEVETLEQPDPTWALEYGHFKALCAKGESNIANDVWINETLKELSRQALEH
jgi:scyllo-inositol 2-dehydrogenase (NADP+)